MFGIPIGPVERRKKLYIDGRYVGEITYEESSSADSGKFIVHDGPGSPGFYAGRETSDAIHVDSSSPGYWLVKKKLMGGLQEENKDELIDRILEERGVEPEVRRRRAFRRY